MRESAMKNLKAVFSGVWSVSHEMLKYSHKCKYTDHLHKLQIVQIDTLRSKNQLGNTKNSSSLAG